MRIALGVEYEGTHYHGFQRQQELVTIQGLLESALSRVADHSVQLVCAGRTDAGVHASAQVIHFDTQAERSERAWVLGGNACLPPDIRIQWAKKVQDNFSARFSALSRSYRYIIENQPIRSALMRHFVSWYPMPLDEAAMQEAANHLLGEQDFSAFRSSSCQSLTPFRRLEELNVKRVGNQIILDIRANAFLHHMVRNIVGVLVEIGAGKKNTQWSREVLESRNRALAGIKMPASGLCLVNVEYPVGFFPAKVKNPVNYLSNTTP